MYHHNLPGWAELLQAFNAAGYDIEVDLANEVIVTKTGQPDELLEYDNLPDSLKLLLDEFAESNNLHD